MRWCVSALIVALIAVSFPLDHAAFAQSSGAGPISMAQLEAKVRDACRGSFTLGEGAVQRADMDGDGRTDTLFNWAKVTCATGGAMQRRGAGFCGMHNCSVDVYLSSQYKPGGWPKPILNHQEIDPRLAQSGGQAVLRTAFQGGSCEFAKVCQREWRWNGSKLVSREVSEASASSGSAKPANPPELAVTREAITGRWVDAADGCASDAVLVFKASGDYAAYERIGDWRLLGKRIAVVVRETFILGEAGSRTRVADPKAVMLNVLSVGPDSLKLRGAKGVISDLRRCS